MFLPFHLLASFVFAPCNEFSEGLGISYRRHTSSFKRNVFPSGDQCLSEKKEIHFYEKEKPSSRGEIIINHARTASFMMYWPSITTFTLVHGWRNDTLQDLRSAVKEVVNLNPILTGRVTRSTWPRRALTIKLGAFSPDDHEFVKEIDISSELKNIPNIKKLNATQILDFMDDFIVPNVSKSYSVVEVCRVNKSLIFAIYHEIFLSHIPIT